VNPGVSAIPKNRHVRTPHYVLGAGGAATILLFLSRLFHSPLDSFAGDLIPLSLAGVLVQWLIPFVPVALAAAVYLRKRRDGYLIRSISESLYLPKEFFRLLGLADRLKPKDLFDEPELQTLKTSVE
jgi:hypothetical protein